MSAFHQLSAGKTGSGPGGGAPSTGTCGGHWANAASGRASASTTATDARSVRMAGPCPSPSGVAPAPRALCRCHNIQASRPMQQWRVVLRRRDMQGVKVLLFDVFGTLVDWRSSIAREAQAILSPLGMRIDWEDFADAWRGEYQPAMDEVRSGRLPFSKLDVLHRRNLDRVLNRMKLAQVDDPTRARLNQAWH